MTSVSSVKKTFPQTELPSANYATAKQGQAFKTISQISVKERPRHSQNESRQFKSLQQSQRMSNQSVEVVQRKSAAILRDQKAINNIVRRCEATQS